MFFSLLSFFQLYFALTYSDQSFLAGLLQAFKDNNDFIRLSDSITNSSPVLAVSDIEVQTTAYCRRTPPPMKYIH